MNFRLVCLKILDLETSVRSQSLRTNCNWRVFTCSWSICVEPFTSYLPKFHKISQNGISSWLVARFEKVNIISRNLMAYRKLLNYIYIYIYWWGRKYWSYRGLPNAQNSTISRNCDYFVSNLLLYWLFSIVSNITQ